LDATSGHLELFFRHFVLEFFFKVAGIISVFFRYGSRRSGNGFSCWRPNAVLRGDLKVLQQQQQQQKKQDWILTLRGLQCFSGLWLL